MAASCAPAKAPAGAEVPAEYRSVRMVAATLGSAGSAAIMGLATVFNKYIPETEWSSSSGSTGTNAIYVTKGTIKLGQTAPANYIDAYGFDKVSESRLRSITTIFSSLQVAFLIPEDKPWKDITQVPKGLTLNPGSPGSNTAIMCDAWLKLAGRAKTDFNVVPLGMQQMADAWREGKLDIAYAAMTGIAPWLMDMHTSPRKFKLMGLSAEQAARAKAEQTFERLGADGIVTGTLTEMVPEVFKADVVLVQQTPMLVSRDDFPEDLAHKMARVIDEHRDELIKIYAPLKYANPQYHLSRARPPLDVHPGVAKYYKEKGYLK